MKSFLIGFVFALVLGAAVPASAQCSCTSSPCSCNCKTKCCVCACGGGACNCRCVLATTLSIASGTKINAAAATVSSAIGEQVLVLTGGDQVTSVDIKTTPWQVLARLSSLPGVKLGFAVPPGMAETEAKLGLKPGETKVAEFRRVQSTEKISLCVSEEAGLVGALDSLSRISGYAFDVYGTPAAKFTVSVNDTIDTIVAKLSEAAGVSITIAR